MVPVKKDENAKGRISIIGAGPSGLVCGIILQKLGYHIEVFEKNDYIGGKLAKAIPNFRLSRSVVDDELREISEKLSIHCRKELGVDF